MKRLILSTLLFAVALGAQAQQLPPGKWWRMPKIVQTLQITEQQQTQLDGVFRSAANDLIDLRAEIEKASLALRGALDQPRLDRAELQRVARRLNDARGKLFERELMMLADMRGVLNDAQWTRLRAELEVRQEQRRDQRRGQDQQQPPPMNRRRP